MDRDQAAAVTAALQLFAQLERDLARDRLAPARCSGWRLDHLREVIKAALAHMVPNKVEAYTRSDRSSGDGS